MTHKMRTTHAHRCTLTLTLTGWGKSEMQHMMHMMHIKHMMHLMHLRYMMHMMHLLHICSEMHWVAFRGIQMHTVAQ